MSAFRSRCSASSVVAVAAAAVVVVVVAAAAAAAAAVVVVVAAAAAVVVIVVVVVVLFSFIASNCLARHTVDRLSAAGFQQRKPQRTTKKTTWAFKSICYGNLSMQNVITDDEEQYCCEITLFW